MSGCLRSRAAAACCASDACVKSPIPAMKSRPWPKQSHEAPAEDAAESGRYGVDPRQSEKPQILADRCRGNADDRHVENDHQKVA